jgi:putative glutamine amidotransferase
MTFVLISQKVCVSNAYKERRDGLDQQWYKFLAQGGITPIPVPNDLAIAKRIFGNLEASGLILSGGNDLASVGGDAPERDRVENYLLSEAINQRCPVIGICRGMQFIAEYYGSRIDSITNHAGRDHEVRFQDGTSRMVNSYHNYGLFALAKPLAPLALSHDGSIEAFKHPKLPIAAFGWHPERFNQPDSWDIGFFKQWFGVE